MENLIISPGKISARKVVGIGWILFGIVFLIVDKDSLNNWGWIRSIGFCLIGVISLTPLVGTDKPKIEICDGCLKIIWINWVRKVTVLDSEIESIILAQNGILIKRKDKKPLKINFYSFSKEQKEKTYKFFIEYAQLKNLVQEKKHTQIWDIK
jgi:hypothetical protein